MCITIGTKLVSFISKTLLQVYSFLFKHFLVSGWFSFLKTLSLSTSFTHQLSSGINRTTDNKNSYISNANISSIINNTTSNHLNKINSNDVNLSNQQITSNPLYWTTAEVCKYLLDNKFDPNLTNLIKEHVILYC